MTFETDSKEGVAVQARVFRWSQADGEDKLEKTDDVVVSPPVLTVRGGIPSTFRLVRVAKTPEYGEETYRVLIDQIPDRKKLQAGSVALSFVRACRFSSPALMRAQVAHMESCGAQGEFTLEAANAGQKRVKLTRLAVTDEKNNDLVKNGGLAYVLGGQTKSWELSGAAAGKTLTIKAESDTGPINASAFAGRSG